MATLASRDIGQRASKARKEAGISKDLDLVPVTDQDQVEDQVEDQDQVQDQDEDDDHEFEAAEVVPAAGPSHHDRLLGRLLPPDKPLTWVMDLEQPEALYNMVNFVKPFVTSLTMYATDKRQVVVGKGGERVVTGFRGIAIDAVDASNVCMTIARLSARVCLSFQPGGDIDAVPDEKAPAEAAVTVETKTLLSMLKDVKANETMVMHMVEDSSDLSIAVTDASGETSSLNMRTMESPVDHGVMDDLTYQYELAVPLTALKSFVRRSNDLKAEALTISLYEVTQGVRVLCLLASGTDADIFKVLPLGDVKTLGGGGTAGAEASGPPSAEDAANSKGLSTAERVAALRGSLRSEMLRLDERVKIPVRPTDLDPRRMKYRGAFSLKYLYNMITPLAGSSQLSLFLPGDYDPTAPLLMRFDLGRCDSYVAFVLAARVDEETS
jgi:hypothetical protein